MKPSTSGPVGLGSAQTGSREAPGNHLDDRRGHLAGPRPGTVRIEAVNTVKSR